jgi:hypothetical protein
MGNFMEFLWNLDGNLYGIPIFKYMPMNRMRFRDSANSQAGVFTWYKISVLLDFGMRFY